MTLLLWIHLLLHGGAATSLELLPIQNEVTAAQSERMGDHSTAVATTLLVSAILEGPQTSSKALSAPWFSFVRRQK